MPIVTIIVLCYHNMNYLWNTLDSIKLQDYSDIQLIISDDASGDFLVDEVKRYVPNAVVNINSENIGTVKHLNKLLPLVQGNFIKNLSPGDEFVQPSSLSEMVAEIGDADALVSPVLAYNSKVKYLVPNFNTLRRLQKTDNIEQELLVRNEINIIGSLIRTSVIEKFDEEYRLVEDWSMWLRLARQGAKFRFSEKVFCNYALGGISTGGGKDEFDIDVIKFYEKEVLPNIKSLSCRKRHEVMFEYKKTILRKKRKLFCEILFIAEFWITIIARRYKHFRNTKESHLCKRIKS